MQLLINHIGYEQYGYKSALILSHQTIHVNHADIVDCRTGQSIQQYSIQATGSVDEWHVGQTYLIDFSDLETCGEFQIRVGEIYSPAFSIATDILFERTFSDVLHYFKSQRCSGLYDQYDRSVPCLNSAHRVDLHGGWYDASGDVSKYLSHLSYANYLNPQQIPMVVWNMLTALSVRAPHLKPFIQTRLADEAIYGADFLVRMQAPEGFFYTTVFDQWSKDPARRDICSYQGQDGHKNERYQAGFRQGAGIAIAALALAARLQFDGEFNHQTYQKTAEKGYWHLKKNNRRYLDDQCENTIDFYCALLASIELYQLTANKTYLEEARLWASRLAEQQQSDAQVSHFWSANGDGSRPYFHAAEAGLPAIALMQYLKIETDCVLQQKFQQVLMQSLQFELQITHEVNNPFGYPRQYIKNIDTNKRTSFFIAQNNETGYWWQGENARLASLASMAFMAQSFVTEPELKKQLSQYAMQSLAWILGLNPHDMCMLDGHGRNNPNYLPHLGFDNAKGGICNGFTAGFENEHDIAFNPEKQKDDILQNWRWAEQWIPHAAWYLLAIALIQKDIQDA